MSIGREIRRLREEQQLSLSELARRSKMTPGGVRLIELGRREPSSTSVEKLAGGLGVEPGELYPKVVAG